MHGSITRPSKALALEVFCGSASLSLALQEVGFECLPVDWSGNTHKSSVPIKVVDLTTETGGRCLWAAALQPGVAYVHFAPPCGTFSRAREVPIPRKLKEHGVKEPQPLRSTEKPYGLPGLSAVDEMKVQKANSLVKLMGGLVQQLQRKGIMWSIENPRNSILWQCDEMKALSELRDVYDMSFQACMHGGQRDKWTTWRTNASSLSTLAVACDKSHTHLPWGVLMEGKRHMGFHTQFEAEYPMLLCRRVSEAIAGAWRAAGNALPSAPERKCSSVEMASVREYADKHKANLQDKRARTGSQARSGTQPLVPEFRTVVTHRCSGKEAEQRGWKKGEKWYRGAAVVGVITQVAPTRRESGDGRVGALVCSEGLVRITGATAGCRGRGVMAGLRRGGMACTAWCDRPKEGSNEQKFRIQAAGLHSTVRPCQQTCKNTHVVAILKNK